MWAAYVRETPPSEQPQKVQDLRFWYLNLLVILPISLQSVQADFSSPPVLQGKEFPNGGEKGSRTKMTEEFRF